MALLCNAAILNMPQFANHDNNVWKTYEPSPALGFTLLHPLPAPPLYQQRAEAARVSHWLQAHGVQSEWVDVEPLATGWRYHLTTAAWETLTPEFDTLNLVDRLGNAACTRELEIAVTLLASPVELVLPSFDELSAHINARKNTCAAGENTTLAFATETAERPGSHWTYHEDTGFTVLPGAPLIEALTLATQPATSGEVYSFSCYRATEYVMLLGLAQTCQDFNPQLLKQLQAQWQTSAIASGRFHDTFLTELGSLEKPIPARYYIPGDRVWFRNPDEPSSDAVGFEGSWVVYLGQGQFTDFWRPHSRYTFEGKCLEIYYWREAVVPAANGTDVGIDEHIVWQKMEALLGGVASAQPDAMAERDRILAIMTRYRDGRGIYANGGCVDATREHLRWLCPAHAQIQLPTAVSNRPSIGTTASGARPASTRPA